MKFDDVIESSFCEGDFLGVLCLNRFSSLYISYIGYQGSQYKNELVDIKKLYVILILCGLSSFMFHYTMFFGWKMFYEITMIMILSHSIYILKKIKYYGDSRTFTNHSIILYTFNIIFVVVNFSVFLIIIFH